MSCQRECIETWFRRVWTEEDADAIEELFVGDGQAFGLSETPMGPKEFRVFHTALCALMTGFRLTIDEAIEMNDRIWAVCTLRGRSRSDARREVAMHGFVIVRCEEGRIVEAYNLWDFLGLFAQLGQLPPDAFQRGLGGESFQATR